VGAVLGLRQNWKQFWLLVLVNGLVGGMIGLERTLLPKIAEQELNVHTNTIILSFIVLFGLSKSITNFLTGIVVKKIGGRNTLILGWLIGIPVPFILMNAESWNWIIMANILLGINQGLAWSSTVLMKIDLVGEKERGLAMGLNEFAGYLAVAVVAYFTGYIAEAYGLRPFPFYIGVGLAFAGLILSVLFVKDTHLHVRTEIASTNLQLTKDLFLQTTWKHRNLGSVTQAGFVNNLNDAMVWGLLPIVLANKGFDLKSTALIVALYPAVWGVSQLATGKLSDYVCKKHLLFTGMFVQGITITLFVIAHTTFHYTMLSVTLGIGTAIVYPTFLSSIAENVHPAQRAFSVGTFRFWRDFGYVAGAALTGIVSDVIGYNSAILIVGFLTIGSSFIVYRRMYCL
jgi:MFS family permease